MLISKWNIEEMTGYKPITTFWMDFSTAENFGVAAVKDTYKRAFNEWKGNYEYLTELVMVLNHKIWQWHERNEELAKVYNELWEEASEYALDNLKDNELAYYFDVTD